MKVVLTCGHPFSGYQYAHQLLCDAGLTEARPSHRRGLSANVLHEMLYAALDLDPSGLGVSAPLAPGRVWLDAATDLLSANAQNPIWGWADARSVWLLDFWKAVEPSVLFVLVYAPAEAAFRSGQVPTNLPTEGLAQYLVSWRAYNEHMTRFYLRNAERCLLVNAAGVRHDPVRFVEVAASKLHLWIRAPEGEEPAVDDEAAPFSAELANAIAKVGRGDDALYHDMESAADITAHKALSWVGNP